MFQVPSKHLAELLELLDIERIEEWLFLARHPADRRGRLYGGQIMAQALRAALATVAAERVPHSLHGYFLRPGDPSMPALIEVEAVRDGRSFSTRRVRVIQHGQAIFAMDMSFHLAEAGPEHGVPMPAVDGLAPPADERIPAGMHHDAFLAWRHEHKVLKAERPHPPRQHVWFRSNGPVPDDAGLHYCLLVYESDEALLGTARLPFRGSVPRERMQVASLDHAMWFHRPALERWRIDRWLLYALDSPSASGARGYTRGTLFTREGLLLASSMQEGLVRLR